MENDKLLVRCQPDIKFNHVRPYRCRLPERSHGILWRSPGTSPVGDDTDPLTAPPAIHSGFLAQHRRNLAADLDDGAGAVNMERNP